MEGTVPLSLKEAVRVLTGGSDDSTACRRSSSSDSPVDILAVVVDITYDRFGGQRVAAVDRREFARIWIADDSIEDQLHQQQQAYGNEDVDDPKISFMISLRNVKDRAAIQQHQFAIGDVIRFNRVGIRKSNNNSTNTTNTNIFHFYHPFENPEAGLEWFRLSHVQNNEGTALIAMERIPDSMKTDVQRLQQLLAWFFFSSPHVKLDPLPCQRRSLLQLQSLVGALSHVVARVINIRQAAKTTTASSLSSKKHYKRQKITATSILAPRPSSSWCAELSDDGGRHSMLLLVAVDSCSLSSTGSDTLRQVLLQANETKRPVRITLVRTRRDETNIGDDSSEVFLVATNQSTATFLTASEEEKVCMHEEEIAASSTQLQHQTQLPFSSCTQQDQQQHHQQPTPQHSFYRTTQKIKASVRQIIVDQDKAGDNSITHAYSLNEKSTAQEYSNFHSQFLCGNNDNTYVKDKTFTFTLELALAHDHRQKHQQTQDRQQDENCDTRPSRSPATVFVSSTPAILERLCGGGGSFSGIVPDVDADQQQQQQQKRRDKNTATMLANILQALLANQVQLEWSLLIENCRQQPAATPSNQPNLPGGVVQDVTLPAI